MNTKTWSEDSESQKPILKISLTCKVSFIPSPLEGVKDSSFAVVQIITKNAEGR